MNVVIGAGGQDGSYVYDKLIELRHPVIGLGRNGILKSANINDDDADFIATIQERLGDWDQKPEAFLEFIMGVNAKVIYDCAASHTSTRGFAKSNQREMYRLNVRRTTCIQDALIISAEKGFHPRLITCGSSLMYDGTGGLRVNEETRMSPTTGYGYAKLIARDQCGALRNLGIEASMAILFNHDSVRRSQEYFLPRAVKAVFDYSKNKSVKSFGCLKKRIDIGSAKDVASALIKLSQVERLASDYVVATGRLTSLAAMVDYIGESFGISAISEVLSGNERYEDTGQDYLVGDISKMVEDVGWIPKENIFYVIDELVQRARDEK